MLRDEPILDAFPTLLSYLTERVQSMELSHMFLRQDHFQRMDFGGWGGDMPAWNRHVSSKDERGVQKKWGDPCGRVPPIAAASWPDYFTTGYPAFSQPAT